MYSEYSRYNKTNAYMGIQNQKNHYQQLINPRNTMRINRNQDSKSLSLNHHNKFSNDLQRQRKKTNDILNKHLVGILKGKGILTKMQQKAQQQKNKKNLTMLNEFKIRQQKNEIHQDNKILVDKITKVKPLVGNKKQWKVHEEQYKTIQRKLCTKKNEQTLNPHKLLRLTFNSSNTKHQLASNKTPKKKHEQNKNQNHTSSSKKDKRLKAQDVIRNQIMNKSVENHSSNNFRTLDQ